MFEMVFALYCFIIMLETQLCFLISELVCGFFAFIRVRVSYMANWCIASNERHFKWHQLTIKCIRPTDFWTFTETFSRHRGVREHTDLGLYIWRTKELSLSASGSINEYGKIVCILFCKCNQMQKGAGGKHQKQMLVTRRNEGSRTASCQRALQTFWNSSLRVV